jgi:pilus assembly protein FimV
MIRKTLLAASAAALLSPAAALALSLGNIQVGSALNEPFRAAIPVRGAKLGELDELRARLGDDQQFTRAGLDRAFVLTKLRFKVRPTGGSSGVIELSTREPLAEPFLNFLVEASWSRGRVLREYTVLLDPPVYGSALNITGRSLRTVEPPAASAPAPAPAARRGTLPQPTPEQIRAATGSRGAPSPGASTPPRARYGGDSYGPVRRGETLWSIADRVRPSGTSIQAMMLALLKANPDAFNIDNINALKTGAVLRIPAEDELRIGRAEALAETTRQHALWDEYRQSLGRTVATRPAGSSSPPSTAAAAPSTSGAATAAGAAQATGELKLVGGSSAGGGAGEDVKTLRDELSMAQEQADAAQRQNDDLKSRLDEAEALVGDLQRLVSIKEDQLAALQDQLGAGAQAGGGAASGQMQVESGSGAAPMEAASTTTATQGAGEKEPSDTQTATSATMQTGGSEQAETETPAMKQEPAAAAQSKAEKAAKQKKQRQAAAKTRRAAKPPEPASVLDTINDLLPVPLWSVLAALGVGLVGIGGLRFARARKAARDEQAEGGALPGAAAVAAGGAAAVAAEAAPGGSTLMDELEAMEAAGDSTQVPDFDTPDFDTEVSADPDAATVMGDTAPSFSDVGGDTHVEELDDDPLAEVNVYLAYERFEQAEELVRDAIISYPDREDYRLKLVEVFYASKDTGKFEDAAQELRDAVGAESPMMSQVQEWWSELGVGHSLFAGGPAGMRTVADDDVFDVASTSI